MFQTGDVVVVKNLPSSCWGKYRDGLYISNQMEKYKGEKCVVCEVCIDGVISQKPRYKLKLYGSDRFCNIWTWWWCDSILELYSENVMECTVKDIASDSEFECFLT